MPRPTPSCAPPPRPSDTCWACSTADPPRLTAIWNPRKDDHEQAQSRDRGQGPCTPGRGRATAGTAAATALGTHHGLPADVPVAGRGLGRLLATPLALADRCLPGRLLPLPGHAGDVQLDRAHRAGGARRLLPGDRVGHPRRDPALE